MEIIVVGLSHKTARSRSGRRSPSRPTAFTRRCGPSGSAQCARGRHRVHVQPGGALRGGPRPEEGVSSLLQFMADYHGSPRGASPAPLRVGRSEACATCSAWPRAWTPWCGRAPDPGPGKGRLREGRRGSATGLVLNRFMHKAFSAAKRVRTETRIAQSAYRSRSPPWSSPARSSASFKERRSW